MVDLRLASWRSCQPELARADLAEHRAQRQVPLQPYLKPTGSSLAVISLVLGHRTRRGPSRHSCICAYHARRTPCCMGHRLIISRAVLGAENGTEEQEDLWVSRATSSLPINIAASERTSSQRCARCGRAYGILRTPRTTILDTRSATVQLHFSLLTEASGPFISHYKFQGFIKCLEDRLSRRKGSAGL